jgi:putative DNA primase/helicase
VTDPFSSPAPASGGPSRFTLEDLLDRLGGAVDEESDGYLVRCPAHEDSHASLRIGLTEGGKVLLKCRAGCKFPDVLKAAKLRASDLFDVEPGNAPRLARADLDPVGLPERAALALYLHRAAQALHGAPEALAYAARRFGLDAEHAAALGLGYDDGHLDGGNLVLSSGKYHDAPRLVVPFHDFDGNPHYLQARALPGHEVAAKWSGPVNPDGAAWAKYGVFRAESSWDEVIITEGPGDALTACAVGYDTVLIRGAGLGSNPTLADEIAEGVNGRKVVVAGGADTAGQKFTNDVAAALSARGVDVFRLTIPAGVGSDLTDWREHGGTSFSKGFPKAVQEAAPYGSDEITSERIQQKITRLFSDVYNAEVLHELIKDSGADIRWTPEVGFVVYEEAHGVKSTLLDALEERGAIKTRSGGQDWMSGIRRVRPSEVGAEDAAPIASFTPDSTSPESLPF